MMKAQAKDLCRRVNLLRIQMSGTRYCRYANSNPKRRRRLLRSGMLRSSIISTNQQLRYAFSIGTRTATLSACFLNRKSRKTSRAPARRTSAILEYLVITNSLHPYSSYIVYIIITSTYIVLELPQAHPLCIVQILACRRYNYVALRTPWTGCRQNRHKWNGVQNGRSARAAATVSRSRKSRNVIRRHPWQLTSKPVITSYARSSIENGKRSGAYSRTGRSSFAHKNNWDMWVSMWKQWTKLMSQERENNWGSG